MNNEHEITINKLELASELAHAKLITNHSDMILYKLDDKAITSYTDEAQDIFNEYYDEYLGLIEQCKM